PPLSLTAAILLVSTSSGAASGPGDRLDAGGGNDAAPAPENTLTVEVIAAHIFLLARTGNGFSHAYARLEIHAKGLTFGTDGRPRPYARCASVSYQIDERAAQAARAAETATAARLVQMGYIKTWDEFQSAVEILYGNSPAKVSKVCVALSATVARAPCLFAPRDVSPHIQARYLVNIRRVDGCLVFKVTDDKTVRGPV
ncbi:MAG: hypothetical protein BJ554DRAFT_5544, partial [Olpidium bornovanus]